MDLETWFGIGAATAGTNGLMQFDDTNAPNLPARFYNTIPQQIRTQVMQTETCDYSGPHSE